MTCKPTVFVPADPKMPCDALARLANDAGWEIEKLRGPGLPLHHSIWAGARCVVERLSRISPAQVNALGLVGCGVVLITGRHAVAETVAAMQAGATTVLPVPVAPAGLGDAVREALRESARASRGRDVLRVLTRMVRRLDEGDRRVLADLFESGAHATSRSDPSQSARRAALFEQLGTHTPAMLDRLAEILGREAQSAPRDPQGRRAPGRPVWTGPAIGTSAQHGIAAS